MKPGDTVYRSHGRWIDGKYTEFLDPITVTAVGRTWVKTSFGRVARKPDSRGAHLGEYGLTVFPSKLAGQIGIWHQQAAAECSRTAFRSFTPDQLAAVIAIVAPDFEPMPKETP